MDFISTLSFHPPRAHLVAKGELDAFAGVELRNRLDDAIDRGCIHFSIDLSAITFVDAGGLGTLVRLNNAVAPFGGTVAVVAASTRFRQIAGLVGLGEVFDLDLLPDAPGCGPGPLTSHTPRRARDARLPAAAAHAGPSVRQ